MRDIPVALNGFRLTVVEAPEVKQKRDGSGPVTDRNGATQFVVSLFVKQRPVAGQRTPKGEEIRVTLASDPGEGFGEGEWVELIDARVNAWEMRDEETGRVSSGLAFKALGMKLTGTEPVAVSAASEK
ncbi:hypothetical protein GCM10023321_41520 [Pseudonocardia eucalypti]|uniref:Uncharacterized protein n=1 Tax=Pseudonocardia eucalypti TaxID=648755 RepID=A0ABP9QD01_9PSEU